MIQMKINKNLIPYFKTDSNTEFTKYFYGISINKEDIKDFEEYSKAILYRDRNFSPSKIANFMNVSRRKIENWLYNGNHPFIIRLLNHYLTLGKPGNDLKWLSVNSTRGGLFIGPWIKVPYKITNYSQISPVLNQLNNEITSLNISFGYLLGFFIGDCSKNTIRRKQRVNRRITVRLSRGFTSNERLGEYVSFCARRLGLRMKRTKDCPAGRMNTHPFYTWISQSSTLIQWIFNVCLGLKNSENTTYDKIKSDWILLAPNEFKVAFLQGLADSDGFVDFTSQQVGIITEPNTEFIKKIFDSLNIKTTTRFFTKNRLWSLMMSIKAAYNLPIFNPTVKSYRYEYMEKLFKAIRIPGHWPISLRNKIKQSVKEGFRGTKLVKKILDEEGIAIRTKNIFRIVKELEK